MKYNALILGFAYVFLLTLTSMESVFAFVAPPGHSSSGSLGVSNIKRLSANGDELTPQESGVYQLLKDLSDSELSFRIVVVGNGAILESTNQLGPTFKVGKSPKSGASIVTFASENQSFEFHLMPDQITAAALVEKASPAKEGKTLRLLRFLNSEGGSICSLILADDSDLAQNWYQSMITKYGSKVEF
mmetsp:Transcript_34296/g.39046  ORF Transcript_34296/g.39046 Transcript_34296/m.39046 type:complete len:188 (-) Transcript_34296:190-753(-)|eukprot:CAMPEP_0194149726 /NCGR_PEP_ID=MMETSP0152-20130528/39578_1 /TAXON_ID=1049557 /ORGANISM="Thalassiothrix antarctica, Strain L6-D1" /LENGTH=187 /DNA_ID=CAMNT_0038852141 /DNA_START=68 /DNA_END=631 /DNA_ORIENTATION=+